MDNKLLASAAVEPDAGWVADDTDDDVSSEEVDNEEGDSGMIEL